MIFFDWFQESSSSTMQQLRTFLEISGVIIFHFTDIMNILLELDYLRVLSLCSAPSCHHHKWSWMSIVSIFGSQDLPSTSVRHMSGGRWSVVDFVNSFIDELQQFRHRCCNWSEFDEALLGEAQLRSEDAICFQSPKIQEEVGTLRRGDDSWERE